MQHHTSCSLWSTVWGHMAVGHVGITPSPATGELGAGTNKRAKGKRKGGNPSVQELQYLRSLTLAGATRVPASDWFPGVTDRRAPSHSPAPYWARVHRPVPAPSGLRGADPASGNRSRLQKLPN